MEWTMAITFVVTSTLFNITPGPAVIKVVGDAMGNGWRPAQLSIAGVLAANGVYCMLSALGLSGIILAAPVLFDAIKWVGVAYLVWLGVSAILNAGQASDAEIAAAPPVSPVALLRTSFVLQGANPKSVLFFCALLPVFAGEADGAAGRILVLGVIALVLEYPVLLAYSIMGERLARLATRARPRRIFQAASGLAVISAAAMVARTSLQNR